MMFVRRRIDPCPPNVAGVINGSTPPSETEPEAERIEVNGRLATLVSELGADTREDGMPPSGPGHPAGHTAGYTAGRHRRADWHADWREGRAGRLVERWVPGGAHGVERVRLVAAQRPGWVIAVVGLVVAAIVTAIVVVGQRPAAEPAPPLPVALDTSVAPEHPAVSPRIVVSVVGKVVAPGLVELPSGARVADAVRAAGGAQPGADLTALNLARRLSDGEQIYVGIPVPPGVFADSSIDGAGDISSPGASPEVSGSSPVKGKRGTKTAGGGGRIDLNHASVEQLEQLPGVGPATATRIVTWRARHGRFNSVDQLRDVGGIGAAKLAKLRNLVSV